MFSSLYSYDLKKEIYRFRVWFVRMDFYYHTIQQFYQQLLRLKVGKNVVGVPARTQHSLATILF